MRYILDKDELEALVPREDLQVRELAIDMLAAEVMRAARVACIHDPKPADEPPMPTYNHTRADGPEEPCPTCKAAAERHAAWVAAGGLRPLSFGYCDDCPLYRLMYAGIGTSTPADRAARRLLCSRTKNVSK